MNKRLELLLTTDMGSTRNVPVELGPSKPVFVIGSSGDADLRLRNPAVAAYHCRLRSAAAGFVLENVDPTAVTFFNNQPLVTSPLLREGDTIRLGSVTLVVRLGAPHAATPAASGRRSRSGVDFEVALRRRASPGRGSPCRRR